MKCFPGVFFVSLGISFSHSSFAVCAGFPTATVPLVEGGSFLFFSTFEQKVSLLQVIQIISDREQDATNVCRLQQLGNCAEGLCARVEMNAMFTSFFVRAPCLRTVVRPDSLVCVKNP